MDGHTAHDNAYASFFGKIGYRLYVRLKITRSKIGVAGHRVFVKGVGNRHPDSFVAYIEGYRSFLHNSIIAQKLKSVYRLRVFYAYISQNFFTYYILQKEIAL